MGQIERNIARQSIRSGKPIPERIANAPELIDGLILYLDAFFDLDSERDSSLGASRIPWSKIKEYAVAYDFDFVQTEDLIHFIKRMDNAYLKRSEAKKA